MWNGLEEIVSTRDYILVLFAIVIGAGVLFACWLLFSFTEYRATIYIIAVLAVVAPFVAGKQYRAPAETVVGHLNEDYSSVELLDKGKVKIGDGFDSCVLKYTPNDSGKKVLIEFPEDCNVARRESGGLFGIF